MPVRSVELLAQLPSSGMQAVCTALGPTMILRQYFGAGRSAKSRSRNDIEPAVAKGTTSQTSSPGGPDAPGPKAHPGWPAARHRRRSRPAAT
jgi:hypothetical protein